MKLSHLTDKILLIDTKNLVMIERSHVLKLLHHLKEIDHRKLYSDLKYSSLFDYCTKELGYSEGSAQRRIVAARMLKDMPELEKKIETGKLTLTNISQVNQFFKDKESQREALKQVEGASKKQGEKKLFELSGQTIPVVEKKKRVSEDSMQVAVVLKDETLQLLEEVKNLLGQDKNTDEVLQFALKAAKEKIAKNKFKETDKPKQAPPPPAKVSRYIQAYIKREVFRRDQKCTQCGSIHNLNYDHILPYGLGGTSGIENIRLLCESCNQRGRIKAKL